MVTARAWRGGLQFVDDSQHAVDANTRRRCNRAQISVTSQKDAVFMALCSDEARAVVGRKTGMVALEREDLLHPFGWKIVGLHDGCRPTGVRDPPRRKHLEKNKRPRAALGSGTLTLATRGAFSGLSLLSSVLPPRPALVPEGAGVPVILAEREVDPVVGPVLCRRPAIRNIQRVGGPVRPKPRENYQRGEPGPTRVHGPFPPRVDASPPWAAGTGPIIGRTGSGAARAQSPETW